MKDAMLTTKHYDLTYLGELASGDESFICEMVEYFCSHSNGILKSMDENLRLENWKELRELIHKYIPNLNMVGIKGVIEDANRIEYCSENETNLDEIPALLLKIKSEVSLGVEELKKDFKL